MLQQAGRVVIYPVRSRLVQLLRTISSGKQADSECTRSPGCQQIPDTVADHDAIREIHSHLLCACEEQIRGWLRVLDIISFEASQVQPVPRISAASRMDFLSGLVMVEGAMVALIDLTHLLALSPDEGADPAANRSRAA